MGHNVEVHRCKECHEVVVIVPAGFTVEEEELQAKAEAHLVQCPVMLERMLEAGAQDQG